MKGTLRIVIGFALAAGAIAWMLRSEDLGGIWAAIQSTNIALLALSAAVATTIFPVRARRWKTILSPIQPDLPFMLLWKATAIGFALNHVLPARLGEVGRSYALARESQRVSFPAAFASLAVDRLFDAIALLILFLFGVMGMPARTTVDGVDPVQKLLLAIGVVSSGLLVVTFGLAFFPAPLIRAFEFFARRVSRTVETKGREILVAISDGLSVVKSPTRFVAVLGWALVHWLVNAFAFWIGFKAVGIDAPFAAALFAQTAVAFAVALPTTPGYVGVFQAAGRFALAAFAIDSTLAYAWAWAYWAFSLIPITVIGMVYFVQMGLTLRELRSMVSGGGKDASDSGASAAPENA